MAEEWQRQLEKFASSYEIIIKPLVTYKATGTHNADMPEYGVCRGKTVRLEDIIKDSTIIYFYARVFSFSTAYWIY